MASDALNKASKALLHEKTPKNQFSLFLNQSHPTYRPQLHVSNASFGSQKGPKMAKLHKKEDYKHK